MTRDSEPQSAHPEKRRNYDTTLTHRQGLRGKRVWLFDMDGTLTEAMHDFDAIRLALDLPVGEPILEALARLPAAEAHERRALLDEMEMQIAAGAIAQPGAIELLDRLLEHSARLGIVTRNGKAIAEATLEACALARYFPADSIVSRECAVPKPDPAGVQLLLERFAARPCEAVMVGDFLYDLEAGRRAGVTTIHLDVAGRFEFTAQTDIGVTSLTGLLELFDRSD